jgi:Tfp pilus assembly pilus retraction ATPase PilT
MSTVQIDRLLDTIVKQGASDLHVSVGRPPTIRLHGKLRSLATKVLDSDDCTALMKSITPEKNQQELAEVGGTDFGFAFGTAARFRASVFRQRGKDVPTFSEALRRVLRSDPDVILVGEMRDLETIESAIRAAETGHLVFGTLHTSGAASTINRIIDAFPVTQQEQVRVQLSTSLIAVLSQQLCARADKPGRVAAYEFLVVTPAISNLIRENKTFRIDSAIQTGRKFGMQLLDDHLWKLYSEGKVAAEEVIDKCKNPGELSDKIHRSGGSIGRTELDEEHEAG